MNKRTRSLKPKHFSSAENRRPRVAIIGAGRVGTALAIALNSAGHRIDFVVARRAGSVRRAQKLIGGQTTGLTAKQLSRLTPKDRRRLSDVSLFIISTPDDAMAQVSARLSKVLRPQASLNPVRARVALHTSGALSSTVLKSLKDLGFSVGSLHPLVSISDSRTGADWLTRAYFSVEGDERALRTGRKIVREIGGHSFQISAEAKALYHAAALMASPNLTALFDLAMEMLNRCGLNRNTARKVLLPLIGSTIHNLSSQDPWRALTGTFKRGDQATVRKHIAAIESEKLDEALAAYVALGRHSLKLAGHAKTQANKIEKLLATAFRKTRK